MLDKERGEPDFSAILDTIELHDPEVGGKDKIACSHPWTIFLCVKCCC